MGISIGNSVIEFVMVLGAPKLKPLCSDCFSADFKLHCFTVSGRSCVHDLFHIPADAPSVIGAKPRHPGAFASKVVHAI